MPVLHYAVKLGLCVLGCFCARVFHLYSVTYPYLQCHLVTVALNYIRLIHHRFRVECGVVLPYIFLYINMFTIMIYDTYICVHRQ